MRKISAWLAALALATATPLVSATPAHADIGPLTIRTECYHADAVYTGDDYPWCLKMEFRRWAGDHGFTVYWIQLVCRANTWEFGWDHPAIDGHSLVLSKGDGDVRKTWGELGSNVDTREGNPACTKQLDVNDTYPSAHELDLTWDATLQINLQLDQQGTARFSVFNND